MSGWAGEPRAKYSFDQCMSGQAGEPKKSKIELMHEWMGWRAQNKVQL